jgi:hypothetical protein
MEKIMITYSLSGRKNALELTREIYGYIDSSNHGKFKYERKGILSDIKYEKLARTMIWIEPKDEKKVIEGFKELKLPIKVIHMKIKD